MNTPKGITVDFETKPIEPRPRYPPDPVGVAIEWPDRKAKYYAFGHLSDNNTDERTARRALEEAWHSRHPLLFHNAKFDVAVANERWGLPIPSWDRIHDTMFLIFLDNPYAPNLALKPSSERYLGLAPEEADAVYLWLVEHARDLRIPSNAITPSNFRKYIWMAPGKLVGKYGIGDVVRTRKLFNLLYKQVAERGMLEAYDTEREAMPILLENEREGMRVDLPLLEEQTSTYENMLLKADAWLRKRLDSPGMNIDAPQQLADALESSGVVTNWDYTKPSKKFPNGQRSTSKDNLTIEKFNDKKVYRVLSYRGKLSTALSTFMRPWLETARETGGRIHTQWNQVKKEGAGAITGRLSSSPNFQNIPKPWGEKDNAYVHPSFLRGLLELPNLRRFILPDKGQLLGHRDFSQQELRILAHYENGDLMRAYIRDPELDVHIMVMQLLADFGLVYERGAVKGTNFGILYGMGTPGICRRLGIQQQEARTLISGWHKVMPGVSQLIQDLKEEVRSGGYISTWGGRQYGMPPMLFVDGEARSREYVLLNYLIQGSGADATKRALINFYKHPKRTGRILVNVHDEINFSSTKSDMAQNMRALGECMMGLAFDVPMLSDAKVGPNWGEMHDYKKVKA